MKKIFLFIAFIISTLVLSSCANNGNKIEPIRTEVVEFDMQKAEKMIGKGDKIISDIAVKDKVLRLEYNQFLSNIEDAYDGYKEGKWEYICFYNEEFEDSKLDILSLQNHVFYPTMYHQNIELVSAKITNTYYQNKFFDTSLLTIREEYLGEDIKLKDWYREYTYNENDKGNWVFYTFGGRMNFIDGNFIPNYLKLK